MAKQLKVYACSDGEYRVRCPRCDEKVSPEKSPLFEGFDCPECQQVIDERSLRAYLRALEVSGEEALQAEEENDL